MTMRILIAATLLLPVLVQAQGSAAAPASKAPVAAKEKAKAKPAAEGAELDDDALERGRALVDRQLASRKASLAQQTQRLEGYHLAMEKDSMDAERQMAEERKAFLLYLKSMPQEDRAAAMKNFDERQEGKRKELDKRHLSQYKAWFEETIASNWKTKPLSAEAVTMPAASVASAAPADAEAAAPAPAPAPVKAAAAARPKIKKRAKRY